MTSMNRDGNFKDCQRAWSKGIVAGRDWIMGSHECIFISSLQMSKQRSSVNGDFHGHLHRQKGRGSCGNASPFDSLSCLPSIFHMHPWSFAS